MITSLKPNEVFVFGSNRHGFHGAGSAGLACRGDSNNTWRKDAWFLKAMVSSEGSPDRVGKWAVFGVGKGFQIGKEGMSYAIKTIEFPGHKKSTPLIEIEVQLLEMAEFARLHPEYKFIMTPVGAGLAGYSNEQMQGIWKRVRNKMPDNVMYSDELYSNVEILNT